MQPRAHNRAEFERAWPRILAAIDEAGRFGSKLIVLPEGSVPGYVLGHEPVPSSQLERAASEIAERARAYGATIVYGGAKLVDGRTFNAAIVVGPDGRELGFAAKQFLWHFDRRWFVAGATLDPIDTPLGRLGLLVCADGRIPTIAATLVERGAQMLVMPTAWVTSGRDPLALENVQADLMANVRARENRVPFAVANKCGVELESVAYCGKSALIDADGAFVARGSERDAELVTGELTPGPRSAVDRRGHEPVAGGEPPSATGPVRVAFTAARGGELARLAALAADADAALVLAFGCGDVPEPSALPLLDAARSPVVSGPHGVAFRAVDAATLLDPRGLVALRLAGFDAFVCASDDEPEWTARFARTRAAELRAYVVVFARERAYAVDPDGAIVAGTFDGYRLATFVYDRTRTAATAVAPGTDVLAGLRESERIRASRETTAVPHG